MKALRLGQFLLELAQALPVAHSRLGIKDFSGSVGFLNMIERCVGVLKESSFRGSRAQVCTDSDQGKDMDLLVRMEQQMGKVVQAAGIFEATGRVCKAYGPIVAFRTE